MESEGLVLNMVIDEVSDVGFGTGGHIGEGHLSDVVYEVCEEAHSSVVADQHVGFLVGGAALNRYSIDSQF